MKNWTIILTLLFHSDYLFSQELTTLKSRVGTEDSFERIFISLNGGCSLSCGIPWTLSASSTLRPQGENNYLPENMDDGDRNTAWVEGVNGYGIGEKVIIKFQDPSGTMKIPFRGFSITNGYAKNIETWKSNSRVKFLELSLNGISKYIIELADSIYPQYVDFDNELYVSTGDIVTLEIRDIYKGDKYADTCITDLSLSGAH